MTSVEHAQSDANARPDAPSFRPIAPAVGCAAFLACLSILPIVIGLMIGIMELADWWYAGGGGQTFVRGLLCLTYMISMPFMIQGLATTKDFDPREPVYTYLMGGFYSGAFLGCVLLFSYYSRKQFLLDAETFSGATSAAYTPWLLYSLNSFFDAILLGAPSVFKFEICSIQSETFYTRLCLFLFRLMTVAGLLQTALILWKLKRGRRISDDDLHLLAKHFRDEVK
jgi:hypothetical protein